VIQNLPAEADASRANHVCGASYTLYQLQLSNTHHNTANNNTSTNDIGLQQLGD